MGPMASKACSEVVEFSCKSKRDVVLGDIGVHANWKCTELCVVVTVIR